MKVDESDAEATYIVDRSVLKQGDIILTSDKTALSLAVRLGTQGEYSHAMLWVGGTLIHADGKGVYSSNMDRILFNDPSRVKILRLKYPLSPSNMESLTAFARAEVGKRYSVKEAVSVRLSKLRKLTDMQFCSRLVAQAYRHIGINLVADSDFCSPHEISESNCLYSLDNYLKVATQEQIEFSKTPDPIQALKNDTMEMLESIRNKYNNEIQTIEGIVIHLKKHPEDDYDITQIAIGSGYFNHGEFDIFKNPWRYSDSEFFDRHQGECTKDEMLFLSNFIRTVGKDVQSVHERELQNYINCYKERQLSFYKESIRLYKQIVNTHHLRIDVADQVDKILKKY